MSKMLLITFFELLFLENCLMLGAFGDCPFYQKNFMVFILFLTTNMGDMWEGSPLLNYLQTLSKVTLGGPLFALAHY